MGSSSDIASEASSKKENGSMTQPGQSSPREASDSGDRLFAWQTCKDYLQGAWQELDEKDIEIKRISGGLSNHIFFVSLPKGVSPHDSEPSEVLLRIYGALSEEVAESRHDNRVSKSTAFNLVQDSVIFSLLSERGLGPKLLGTFPEGRLEEMIPARSMSAEEVRDSRLSEMIARQMAKVHTLTMPISKERLWLASIMAKYHGQVAPIRLEDVSDENQSMAKKLLNFDFKGEIEWLFKFLSRVHSPIVFCHNDVQGGNILLRKGIVSETGAEATSELMLIDYEFCGYNYRAFDIANHLSEWMYDYTHKDWPYFSCQRENFPSKERQMEFLRAYSSEQTDSFLSSSPSPASPSPLGGCTGATRRPRRRNLSCDQKTEILLQEVQAFILAAHLLWCLWGVANSTNAKIPFGYWEYATARMSDYQSHKSAVIEQEEFIAGMKRK